MSVDNEEEKPVMMAQDDQAEMRKLAARIDRLIMESSNARRGFVDQARLNDVMFCGHLPPEDQPNTNAYSNLLINKTGQSIIALSYIENENRPRIRVNPRQTTNIPQWCLSRKALTTIKSLIEQGHIAAIQDDADEETDPFASEAAQITGELIPIRTPVDPQGFVFDMLVDPKYDQEDAFEVPEAFIPAIMPLFSQWRSLTGSIMPPALRTNDLFEVNDAMVAKAVQNNIDISWEMDDRDLWLRNNTVNKRKYGVQGSMFLFDKEKRRSTVFDIHYKNLFLPPNCTGVKDAEYVLVRELISFEEADERFPYAHEAIERYKSRRPQGTTSSSVVSGYDVPYAGVSFERDMVEVWHSWWRNERYQMTGDDALDMGRVVMKRTLSTDEMGAPVSQLQYFLTDDDMNVTDKVTTPGAANWPTRNGIRYLQKIGGDIVYDEECAHCDIPVIVNMNIPMSYSPWAQGDPERLWFVQKLIDRMSSIILDHISFFRSPTMILPLSVYKYMKGWNTMHSSPIRGGWIPDDTFNEYRDFLARGHGFYVDPPPMPQGYFELWQFAIQLHDELSGYTGVLQGRAPGANSSGRIVQELQQASRGIVGFQSAQTESMLRAMAKLEIDADAKWKPLFMWAKANDALPLSVLSIVRKRSRTMEFDLVVEVASGGAQTRELRKAEALQEVQMQVRSPESYRRLAEIDADDSEWNEMRKMMVAAPNSAPPIDKQAA